MTDRPSASVSVELGDLDAPSADPPAPTGSGGTSSRAGVVVLALLAVVVGLLWFVEQRFVGDVDEAADPIEEPAEDIDVAEAIDTEDVSTGDVIGEIEDGGVRVWPIGNRIIEAARWRDRWVGLRQDMVRGSRVVESSDGLRWTALEASELGGANLFGLDVVDDSLQTLVNSAALNQQQFTLLAQSTTDGMQWSAATGAEAHRASGNRPTHVDLAFGTHVVVGDQPRTAASPPEELVALLDEYVSPDLAASTCGLTAVSGAPRGTFDLIGCTGEVVGRIGDENQRNADTLATVAFLLRFENVISVQQSGQPLQRLVLDPGMQIASIRATPDGFVATAIDTLGGLRVDNRSIGDPPGVLLQWTPTSGLVDLTSALPTTIDLLDWFDADPAVGADGTITIANSTQVIQRRPGESGWDEVAIAPVLAEPRSALLRIDEAGSMVFGDDLGRVWAGRVGEGWHRVSQLDGLEPIDVLLTDRQAMVVVLDDTFEPVLARIELPASNAPSASGDRQSVSPGELRDIVPIERGFLASTADGEIARSADGLTWTIDTQLSPAGFSVLALGEEDDQVVMLGVSELTREEFWITTFRLDANGWLIAPEGFVPHNDREAIQLGPQDTTSIEFSRVGRLSVVVTRSTELEDLGDTTDKRTVETIHLAGEGVTPWNLDILSGERVLDIEIGREAVYALTGSQVVAIDAATRSVESLPLPLNVRLPPLSDLAIPSDASFGVSSAVADFNYYAETNSWELVLPSGEVRALSR